MTEHLHLAVALEGYGWHPEAWQQSRGAEPLTSGRYWSELAVTAERGLLDFVTFDDGLTPQRRRRPEIQLFGRRDVTGVDLFDEARDAVEVLRRLWDNHLGL